MRLVEDCSRKDRRTMSDAVAILKAIQQDERYLELLEWGTFRRGHPEGTVRGHIAELERNLAALRDRLTESELDRLRLLIHTHDTFKAEARCGVAITDPRSHASRGRAFLAEFCNDEDLLNMVQWHDEPYALWQKQRRSGTVDAERLDALIRRIDDRDTFLAFQIIDNCTTGKSREPLQWFLPMISTRVETRFSVEDLLW